MHHRISVTAFLLFASGCVYEIVEGTSAAPDTTEPSMTEPSTTEPGVTEPGVTEPGVTEPSASETTAGDATTSAPTASGPTTGDTSTDTGASTETGETGNTGAQIEIVRGMVFGSRCEPGDMVCGARAACEAVTGSQCEEQFYDCVSGGAGTSFIPMGGQPMDAFNFGTYAIVNEIGNICACDPSVFAMYNIPQVYEPCTAGGWRFLP